MVEKVSKKPGNKNKNKFVYSSSKDPLEFYISEKTATYGDAKPFSIYYDEPEHSVRLLQGDSIRILNQARANYKFNSMDRI